jgi:hypothetical protein
MFQSLKSFELLCGFLTHTLKNCRNQAFFSHIVINELILENDQLSDSHKSDLCIIVFVEFVPVLYLKNFGVLGVK